MTIVKRTILLCLLALTIFSQHLFAETPFLLQFRNEFVNLAKEIEKCAVGVTAVMETGPQNEGGPVIQMMNYAAGLVIDDHHILVKHKVVLGSKEITINFYNGEHQKGNVEDWDSNYGLALVRVQDPIAAEMHPKIYTESKQLLPGEPVLVLSNSLDRMPAIAFGVVNCSREDGMIQVSTNMPAGSGGGAVFDFHGKLVGIIAAEIELFSDEIPYASDIVSSKTVLLYPVQEIQQVTKALLANAQKKPVYLGILAADWPSQLGGAHVKQVFTNSPAAEAGFRLGDIVLSIDNHKVASAYDLSQEIKSHSPGDLVKFEILRGEQIKDVVVKIASPPQSSENTMASHSNSSVSRPSQAPNVNREFLLNRLNRLEREIQMIRKILQED